jgi:hypothetical protein
VGHASIECSLKAALDFEMSGVEMEMMRLGENVREFAKASALC